MGFRTKTHVTQACHVVTRFEILGSKAAPRQLRRSAWSGPAQGLAGLCGAVQVLARQLQLRNVVLAFSGCARHSTLPYNARLLPIVSLFEMRVTRVLEKMCFDAEAQRRRKRTFCAFCMGLCQKASKPTGFGARCDKSCAK